jgi:hypothetical protein
VNTFYHSNTYYGGFDPGSGRAGLKVYSANGSQLQHDLMTIDSCMAMGNADDLLARGDINARVCDVLRDGEALISMGGSDYFLQDLTKEGRNVTYALGNPARYWGEHAQVLLLALACQLVQDRMFTLRVVTALPVSLYTRENRARMKKALSKHYRFQFNGQDRDVVIDVGYVCMEGQGALIHAGLSEGDQAVIDVGERTSDFIAASGQKLTVNLCKGNENLGVGILVDALDKLFKRYGRVLPTQKLHDVLEIWTDAQIVMPDYDTPQGTLAGALIASTIRKSALDLAKGIVSFAASIWNVEGESVGQRFDRIVIAGGGAHYIGDFLPVQLPRTYIPADPEDANLSGYLDLALQLEDKLQNAWVA